MEGAGGASFTMYAMSDPQAHEGNTLNNFTVKLPRTYNFDTPYEVSLIRSYIPYQIYNIKDDNYFKLTRWAADRSETHKYKNRITKVIDGAVYYLDSSFIVPLQKGYYSHLEDVKTMILRDYRRMINQEESEDVKLTRLKESVGVECSKNPENCVRTLKYFFPEYWSKHRDNIYPNPSDVIMFIRLTLLDIDKIITPWGNQLHIKVLYLKQELLRMVELLKSVYTGEKDLYFYVFLLKVDNVIQNIKEAGYKENDELYSVVLSEICKIAMGMYYLREARPLYNNLMRRMKELFLEEVINKEVTIPEARYIAETEKLFDTDDDDSFKSEVLNVVKEGWKSGEEDDSTLPSLAILYRLYEYFMINRKLGEGEEPSMLPVTKDDPRKINGLTLETIIAISFMVLEQNQAHKLEDKIESKLAGQDAYWIGDFDMENFIQRIEYNVFIDKINILGGDDDDDSIIEMELSKDLSVYMGFDTPNIILKPNINITSPFLMRHTPLTHIYLYADFLERVIVNEKEMKLLALIPMTADSPKFGEYVSYTDEHLIYLPLNKKELYYLSFELRDEQGGLIRFEHGTNNVKLLLHFRPIKHN